MLKPHLRVSTKPRALDEQVFVEGDVRFSVLAPGLLRVEQKGFSDFLDDATQSVWFRDLGKTPFEVKKSKNEIVIVTSLVAFCFDRRARRVVSVLVDGKHIPCNNKKNLKGTCRTLDMATGPRKLKMGVVSKNTVAVMDDSKSLVIKEDGMVYKNEIASDLYIFAGNPPQETLQLFFSLTGRQPLVPRYAFGNWWSRYHAYSQEEYLTLMARFEKEGYPFSVATVDMDWHYVKLKEELGSEWGKYNGWTGYTWNKQLFPNYKEFLQTLKQKGYRTSLNLHPASGVRPYEEAFPQMAKALSHTDPNAPIPFDFTNEDFIHAYFEYLHHPYEADGVDCWWIDWQQGTRSNLEGYDPLWGLNHFHYLDHARDGKRPLILSRYSGLGSHRYPLGFSGDTVILWRMLNFMPYFTANAANAGYFFWSHDVGGHHLGRQQDEELYLRWVQLGIFSPIFRLHSTKIAKSKEPWLFPSVTDKVKTLMQLRHQLIPYLYTASYKSFLYAKPVCEPLYYQHPNEAFAYRYPNEYYFGDQMLIFPITKKSKRKTKRSSVKGYLPKGRYVDFFSGETFEGEGEITFERAWDDNIPVLVKAGSVIPLANYAANETDNPTSLTLRVYAGNGESALIEDDGSTMDYQKGRFATTTYLVKMVEDTLTLTIRGVEGDKSLVPAYRNLKIEWVGIHSYRGLTATVDGRTITTDIHNMDMTMQNVNPSSEIEITLSEVEMAPCVRVGN